MHSIASVRSASGAASYFAKDDFQSGEYYTADGDVSLWGGAGAEAAGLTGEVRREAFEQVLNGRLPDGQQIGDPARRRAGFDLTFSAPKSVSLMAYIAGDKRILGPEGVHMQAVRATMAWIEKNLVEGRRDEGGKSVPVKTGNLTYALFQHDTSRALDPQAHVHAIVANMTRMPDGKWQALHADRIWASNTVIGSVYHAFLREGLEKLGYETQTTGKHGTFEIAGVPTKVIEAFSQRRQDILATADKLGIRSAQGLREVTNRTRDPKLSVEDRDALVRDWREKAAGLGFDGKQQLAAALRGAERPADANPVTRSVDAIRGAVAGARELVGHLLASPDPLVDRAIVRIVASPAAARAQFAVASAVRIHAQREAAFGTDRLAKTALDLGLKGVTVDHVSARIDRLVDKGLLLPGEVRQQGVAYAGVTTRAALATEQQILGRIEAGKGQVAPVVAPAEAPARLQAASPHDLNPGQLAAATLMIASSDRVVAVQGVAGAGKSTMLQAVARVAESEGRSVLGLAFQNKMVADMKEGAGIEAQTIASFLWNGDRYLADPKGEATQVRRDELKNTIIVVDETSMVSSDDMLKLVRVAEVLGVERVGLVGDRQQLSSIDAGKAFAMAQAGGIATARMDENIRQRTDTLRTVAALANVGKAGEAMRVLGDSVIEDKNPADKAADLWLGLTKEEREATAVFASGRETRGHINQRIQDGLAAEGTLTGERLDVTVHDRVNLTREELRYAHNYQPGQQLRVTGHVPELNLKRGDYTVTRVMKNGHVEIERDGRKQKITPSRIDPLDRKNRLELTTLQSVAIHAGDRIRWTANDKERGLFNAAIARIVGIEDGAVTVELASKDVVTLAKGDPMLSRIDLAYALNMHMAQGVTTDRAITMMASYETNLSNQRLFNVGVTRVRDGLTMVVDNLSKLIAQLDRNPGDKTAALEATGKLDIDGAAARAGLASSPALPPLPAGLPPMAASPATSLGQQPTNGPIMLRDLPDPADLTAMPAGDRSRWDHGDGLGMAVIIDELKGLPDLPGTIAGKEPSKDPALLSQRTLERGDVKPAVIPERNLGLEL
ncbi:MobF family relaxase [Sphingomonas sp. Leaf4]|uniref:MobF family relaxase n=1 Tax=Sphingomonas sp. Leaf4 TaxID=2876553 RepID=UPI001E5A8BC1|nr:MobF family relaxase [Sphingomonas sp. Leaf4]